MSDERIRIFDTTLRDGEQSPGCSMNLNEKLALARQQAKLGVDIIEAGFPIASPGDLESVKAISQEVREYANSNTAGDVDQAIDKGMAEMAQEYNEQGRKLYHKV